jgi:penicillin V acylase-like amidase (Ntn superfamily)
MRTGGLLPGTVRAAERFARANYYSNASQPLGKPREAVAAVFSVMRNVSVTQTALEPCG